MELSEMEKVQIEKKVDFLLALFGYSKEDRYVDIVEFTKKMRFTVGNADLKEDEDGLLLISQEKKVIAVNSDRSMEWKRFIIAHEFAHYFLHYVLNGTFKNSTQEAVLLHRENKKGRNESENDADYFAAALLMPRETFKMQYEKYKSEGLEDNEIYFQLGNIFGVPLESAKRRVEEIKELEEQK